MPISSSTTNAPFPIPVRILPYDLRWPSMALAEVDLIRSVFSHDALRIGHIGSTSVPGIAAKPIIDLMGVVADLETSDLELSRLGQLGYQIHGACGITGRIFCTKANVNGERAFHLHIFPESSKHVIRHLAFRDYLRANPLVAREYEHEKVRAATLHPENSMDYSEAKSGWMRVHEQRALKWMAGKPVHL